MGQNDGGFFRKLIEDGQLTRRTLLSSASGEPVQHRNRTFSGPTVKGGEA